MEKTKTGNVEENHEGVCACVHVCVCAVCEGLMYKGAPWQSGDNTLQMCPYLTLSRVVLNSDGGENVHTVGLHACVCLRPTDHFMVGLHIIAHRIKIPKNSQCANC